jgi:hypothetical protein
MLQKIKKIVLYSLAVLGILFVCGCISGDAQNINNSSNNNNNVKTQIIETITKEAFKTDIIAESYGNLHAKNGNVYLWIDLQIKNNGNDKATISPKDFSVSDSSGKKYNIIYQNDGIELFPNEYTDKILVVEIPKNAKNILVKYNSNSGINTWKLDVSNIPIIKPDLNIYNASLSYGYDNGKYQLYHISGILKNTGDIPVYVSEIKLYCGNASLKGIYVGRILKPKEAYIINEKLYSVSVSNRDNAGIIAKIYDNNGLLKTCTVQKGLDKPRIDIENASVDYLYEYDDSNKYQLTNYKCILKNTGKVPVKIDDIYIFAGDYKVDSDWIGKILYPNDTLLVSEDSYGSINPNYRNLDIYIYAVCNDKIVGQVKVGTLKEPKVSISDATVEYKKSEYLDEYSIENVNAKIINNGEIPVKINNVIIYCGDEKWGSMWVYKIIGPGKTYTVDENTLGYVKNNPKNNKVVVQIEGGPETIADVKYD